MKVYLASDHTGLELKTAVKEFLEKKGYEAVDCGALEYDKDDDYPDFIKKAAQAVSNNPGSFGIVFGGSGQGEAIVANKYNGVRCIVFYGPVKPAQTVDIRGKESDDPFEILKLARQHNDANILSLGVRFLTNEDMLQAIKIFLGTPFSNDERHARRIEKIKQIENEA